MRISVVIGLAGLARLFAQSPLSLSEAVQLGLQQNPQIEASGAAKGAADTRIQQARSGKLPQISYSESFQRSDNPVFVFGSLLTQHQFTQGNFDLDQLNKPNFLNNFQSQVRVNQTLYDFGRTKAQVRSAELGSQLAGEDQRRARMGVIANIASAYFGAVLAKEHLRVAQESVRSAEADLQRAETVRAAGMSTDADVLSVRVHLAAMKEREIQARYGVDVANAQLGDALGQPLETQHQLVTALTPATLSSSDLAQFDKSAVQQSPETRKAGLAVSVAEAHTDAARSALFPRISALGAFEADRQRFVTRGGANWLVGASLEWNVFDGGRDRALRKETTQLLTAARAEQKRAESAARLEVRRAYAAWRGAQERITVAAAAVAQAEESLRITRNRYDSGLTTVTELLRNETATLETKTNHLDAIYEQRLAATALELAAGTLSGDSDVLK